MSELKEKYPNLLRATIEIPEAFPELQAFQLAERRLAQREMIATFIRALELLDKQMAEAP